MHPALSVILLTTLIGAGQGLFLALFTAQIYAWDGLLPTQSGPSFYGPGSLLALILLIAGLIASFFHLGRPERAWRSATQWRTSWLSREVIVLPIAMLLILGFGAAHSLELERPLFTLPGGKPVDPTLIIGVLAMLAVLALYLCTAMIYASLKFLQEWHSALTVINYLLLGVASGFTLAAALTGATGNELAGFFTGWAIVLTLLAMIARVATLIRNRGLRCKSTLRTAIGVRHPRIQQKSQGFMSGSFNTREFFHGKRPAFLKGIKWTFLVMAFVLPVALLIAAYLGVALQYLPLLAFAVQYLGLLAERWYFFAEANHPQNLYYQAIA
ncbi:MAG: dimethyl sulfoxide reductase anchor subunit family protein [Thiotrichales bacterium]